MTVAIFLRDAGPITPEYVLEERELTLEESEKVAGGTPIRRRDKSRFSKRSEANNTGSQASDGGSVSGSGSW